MEKLVLVSLVSVLMVGCVGNESYTKVENYFKGSDENLVTEIEDTESKGNDTEKVYNATVTLSELEGSWRKPCGPVYDSFHFDIVTMSYSGSQFTVDIKNYIDPSCTQPYRESPNPTAFIKFKLGNGIMLDDGTIVTEINTRTMHYNGAYFYPVEYNIIYIKNGALYAGDDGLDSTLYRPTKLDYNRPFYRIN